MKKKIFLIAGTIVFIICIIAASMFVSNVKKYNQAVSLIQEEKYEEAHEIFKALGNFKDSEEKCKKFRYVISSYENYKDEENNHTAQYNYKNGKLVSIGKQGLQYDYDCNALTKFTYDKEKVIEVDISGYGPMEWGFDKNIKYEYNKAGIVTKREYRNLYTGLEFICSYTYENNNLKELIERYDMPDAITYEQHYIYDENGNVIKRKYETDYEKSYYEYSYKYKDNKIVEERCTDNEDYTVTTTYKYDEYGNLIEKKKNNNSEYCVTYKYDENNNLIEETSYFNGEVSKVIKYEYEYYYIDVNYDLIIEEMKDYENLYMI